ncbi:hypothetical protein [Nonomuraea glycinis]|uniref:hypothetical protein n=1 Tax=Nonomuraea glycinis TaxID=2047744 RepID=UPI002E0E8530|nr:hypothetical protein OHA68_18290 [Nonomuraea glycinis]
MTEPSGDSGKRSRPVAVPVLALVTLTAVGIAALLGGFDERPAAPPPRLKAGQSLDMGKFEARFIESKVTTEPATSQFTEDKRFLDVVFKVTNKTDETLVVGSPPNDKSPGYSFGGALLKMTPQLKSEFGGQLFVLSKDVKSSQLHPDVPATVIARYELEGTTTPPEQVTYDVGAYEETENPLTGVVTWLLPSEGGFVGKAAVKKVAATVTLPVKQEGTS